MLCSLLFLYLASGQVPQPVPTFLLQEVVPAKNAVINKKSTLAFKTLMLFVGVCELFFMALLFMMLLFDTTKLQ